MPPRKTKRTAKPKAKPSAKPARRPAKRAARPKAKSQKVESQEPAPARAQSLLLTPIPDDAVVKHVVPLLEVDGLVRLMASSKTICERLGAVGTPEGKAARHVIDQSYGVVTPADADILDWGKRLFRWTRHHQVSDELDLGIAKAFACGTVPHGLADELFFEPRPADYEPKEGDIYSIASALAASATWLMCEKKYAPGSWDDDEGDIAYKALRVGEAFPESLEEVVQGVHSRVRLNKRVTVDLEIEMCYGDDPGATINWSLRVEIRAAGGRQSKRLQQAEGIAHWSDFGSDATFGEPLWCGRVGCGDMRDGPPDGQEIRKGCAARLIAALGMPRPTEESHLMGVLLYVLAAPFRWQWGSDAVGPALEYNTDYTTDEANTMLEVIRHQVLLACEWEEGDEDEWDDDDLPSFGKPPRPLCRYREPREGHRTGLWWLGKDPPSDDDFEPPRPGGIRPSSFLDDVSDSDLGSSDDGADGGVASLQKRVLDYHTENGAGGDGCNTDSVAASLGLDIGQVKAAVEFLSSEGHLYSTIDEDHHRSIYLPKKLRR